MGTYVAVVFGEEAQRATWPESLLIQLREWAIKLEPLPNEKWNMVSTSDHVALAGAQFFDAEAGRARYAGEVWVSKRPPCPFLDDLSIVGFVEWDSWSDDPEARRDWLVALVKEGKGFIADPGTGRYRNAVIEASYSATGLLSKWGFDDGDSALTRDDGLKNYRSAVCHEMEKTLADHGLFTDVGGPQYTCHNLFRSYGGFFLDADRTIPLEEDKIHKRLAGITFQFWSYDFTIGDDPMFEENQREHGEP